MERITITFCKAFEVSSAELNKPKVYPIAWIRARPIARYLVYLVIFFFPSSPCLANSSKLGMAMVNS